MYFFCFEKQKQKKSQFCVIRGLFGQRLKTTVSSTGCSSCSQPAHRGSHLDLIYRMYT